MKRLSFRNRRAQSSGFTLIELLVVIAIIAILAAVSLQVGQTVLNAAKRAKAQNTATQIQTATLGYYTEYSVYPQNGSGDTIIGDSVAADGTLWGTLICVLCGNVHPSAPGTTFTTSGAWVTNSRGIAFLSMKSSDVGASTTAYQDAPLNPIGTTTNLWFNIAIDSDYDGLLGTTGNTSGKMPNFALSTTTTMNFTGTSTAGVAIWENCNGTTTKNNPNFWVKTY